MKEIKWKNEVIEYEIIRAPIKNLYIHIKNGKVIVKAPIKLKEGLIQKFVGEKARWIHKKLQEDQQRPKDEPITQEEVERLKRVVQESIKKYEKLLQLKPNKVRIKEVKYAWGSCSSHKNITINLKLAKKEDKVIEYVVLHEMCHLKYMNHSKDFWNLVESQMKNYQEYKKKLR